MAILVFRQPTKSVPKQRLSQRVSRPNHPLLSGAYQQRGKRTRELSRNLHRRSSPSVCLSLNSNSHLSPEGRVSTQTETRKTRRRPLGIGGIGSSSLCRRSRS